uniref:Uncharacterized protein n=1 Tax=Meloidogyne enterolobii TaxID=390850 RepID=A0A6V7WDV6_MELEN|nr:unnamed protein product [Meloidogyne enterolobii]
MLILFFIISLSCPLFNGMDQNDVGLQNACWTSCWNSLGNLCPQNCWDFNFGQCLNDCWNNFCNDCNSLFVNQNATQSDDNYEGEGECEAEDDGEEGEGEHDTKGQWEEGYQGDFQEEHQYDEGECDIVPSSSHGETSYHYGAWDEDIHQSQPYHPYSEGATEWGDQPSSSQTGGMPYYNTWDDDMTAQVENLSEHIQNIKLKEEDLIVQHEALQGRSDAVDYDLLMMFDQRILQNASNVCNHLLSLGPYANEDTPVTNTFCASIRNIELYSNSSKASRENGDIYYYLPLNSIVKAIRIEYYQDYKIYPFDCENIEEIKMKINKIINPERSIRVGNWTIKQYFQMLNDHIAAKLEEGIQFLIEHKNALRNKKLFPAIDFTHDFIKQNVVDIDELLAKAKENACECTYGIYELCNQGGPVDCYSIKAVLSMMAVDIFVTAIQVDGFDFLLGKWPFHIYKYEGGGNQQGQQQIP